MKSITNRLLKFFSEDCWYQEWEILSQLVMPGINTYQICKYMGFLNNLVHDGLLLKKEEEDTNYYRKIFENII